jgi:hypothetical protein
LQRVAQRLDVPGTVLAFEDGAVVFRRLQIDRHVRGAGRESRKRALAVFEGANEAIEAGKRCQFSLLET